MKEYLKRSNNIPMQVLNWLSPIQKREQLKKDANASLLINTFPDLLVSHHLQLYKKLFFILPLITIYNVWLIFFVIPIYSRRNHID